MAVISIKPYVDKNDDAIGLAGLGLNAFPGTKKIFQVPVKNGRFLTGFDEKASYLSSLDAKEREKEIKRIKTKCKEFADLYPHLAICDCALTNEFYGNMSIELSAGNNYFDTTNIMDEIKVSIIKTGAKYAGDSFVASSFEEAMTSNKEYSYYVSDPELDIQTEVTAKKKINNAISSLDKISDNVSDMRLIAKFLLKPTKALNTLSSDGLYNKLDDFIKGIVDGEISSEFKNNHEVFTRAIKMEKQEMLAKVVIKYAIYLNIIRQRADKEYTFIKTGNELGKTPEEMYMFLTNIKNQDIYEDVKGEVNNLLPIF